MSFNYVLALEQEWERCKVEGDTAVLQFAKTHGDFLFKTILLEKKVIDVMTTKHELAVEVAMEKAVMLQRLIDKDLEDARVGFNRLVTNGTKR